MVLLVSQMVSYSSGIINYVCIWFEEEECRNQADCRKVLKAIVADYGRLPPLRAGPR